MNKRPLAGCRILVTRPAGQQQELIEAVEARGGEAVHLPLLAIKPIKDGAAATRLEQQLSRLPDYDMLIFVSVNAARCGARRIAECGATISPRTEVLAVGAATGLEAATLLDRPVASPVGSGSELLLDLPHLEEVAGLRIAIFRGEGGRELLATELRRRGAAVDYLELYRRTPAPGAAGRLEQILAHGPPDIAVVTSAEALARWRELLGEIPMRGKDRSPRGTAAATGAKKRSIALPLEANEDAVRDAGELLKMPVAVPSRRVAELAAQHGFAAVINAGDAGTEAIIEALAEHLRRRVI